MSILNFPSNPTIGQTHVVGVKTYTWNGTAWIITSTSYTAATTGTYTSIILGSVGAGQVIFAGSSGELLGNSNFTYNTVTNSISASVDSASSTTNIVGGTAGQLVYQIGPNQTGFINTGTTGYVLQSNGTSAPTWVELTNVSANTATNILGGDTGWILMQSSSDVTTFIHAGTQGQLLQSQGSTSTFVNTSSIIVGTANSSLNSLIVNTTSSSSVQYITFASSVSGEQVIRTDDALSYTPSTGKLSLPGDIDVTGQIFINSATPTIVGNTDLVLTALNGNILTTSSVQINNVTDSTSTTTGALTISGGVGIRGNTWVGGRINSESLKIADAIFDSTVVSMSTIATTVVDQYPISQFRSAKYLVQIDEGSGVAANFQVVEILLLVDNAGTVYATEYGLLASNGSMGSFSAGVFNVGGIDMVQLLFTPNTSDSKVIKVLRTGLTAS